MKAIICLHIGAAMRNCKKKADKAHQKAPCRGSWRAEGETEGLNRTFYTISIKSLNSQFATTPANRPLIVWYSMALAVKRVLCSSSIMDTCVLR